MKKSMFGDLLRNRRRESGKSIEDIANFMGWSKSYLMNVELGRSVPPTVDKIIKMSNFLGNLDLSEVLGTLDEKHKTIKIDLNNIDDDYKEIFIVLFQNFQESSGIDPIRKQNLEEVKLAIKKLAGV